MRILGYSVDEDCDLVEIYVKRVYTDKVKKYMVNSDANIRRIFWDLNRNIYSDFGFHDVEYVLAGQPRGEEAAAIAFLTDEPITFKDFFLSSNQSSITLYVRERRE